MPRLIDAVALQAEYKKRHNGKRLLLIDVAPTIEPERKTGRWIDRSGGIGSSWNYCSVCGEREIYPYDFCPNCGAYMKGEVDD